MFAHCLYRRDCYVPSPDLKATTIRSLFWKLFEQGGTAVVTLLVQVVMARLLAPDEFGMLAIMLVFVNVGNVIVQSGLNTAIIQAPDIYQAQGTDIITGTGLPEAAR